MIPKYNRVGGENTFISTGVKGLKPYSTLYQNAGIS